MALIVEVLQPRTGAVATRRRIASYPFTIGRALDNALVLDDPFVDAHHAAIELDEAGDVLVRDLASVNGIIVDLRQHGGLVRVRGGAEIRLGRTTLRFRDEGEALPPALPLHGARPAAGPQRWHERAPLRLLFCFLVFTLVGVMAWLESSSRGGASEAVGAGIAIAVMMAAWAGVWALVARSFIHQARFLTHLTIATAIMLAGTALGEMGEWMMFLWPAAELWTILASIAWLALLTASIALHLANATHLPRGRRWRAGVVTTLIIIAFGGLFALTADDGFTDVPTFSGVVRPLHPALVPTVDVEALREAHADLRTVVDSMPGTR